ncbi:MAG: hypothetical protein H0X63_02830 [Flavobacteriales bacterium]|nr:hypothetical protein [Flavobacteriales bacterium]
MDNDTLLYIVLIVLFLFFFLWNSNRLKKNRKHQKDRNFRKRYLERKKEKKE